MYLTYEQYQAYGGALDATAFAEYEFEARTWVDWYTFRRLVNDDVSDNEAVKRCVYKLISLAELQAQALSLGNQTTTITTGTSVTTITKDAPIASQSNDGVSISYNNVSASDMFNQLKQDARGNLIENTITQYLQGVKNSLGQDVLYRGLYANE